MHRLAKLTVVLVSHDKTFQDIKFQPLCIISVMIILKVQNSCGDGGGGMANFQVSKSEIHAYIYLDILKYIYIYVL